MGLRFLGFRVQGLGFRKSRSMNLRPHTLRLEMVVVLDGIARAAHPAHRILVAEFIRTEDCALSDL